MLPRPASLIEGLSAERREISSLLAAAGAAVDLAPLVPPSGEHEGLARDQLLHAYKCMVVSRRLDDRELQLKTQNRVFFHLSGAGHEAINVAAGFLLRPGYDWFYPYYRDRALCLILGVTPFEMLLGAVGAAADPCSGGRQMPSHWGHRRLNIVSQSSPTGTQCLQAVGCAEATVAYEAFNSGNGHCHPDEVTYVSLGDGTTCEGEFWESLNTASMRRLPILYVVEDNGWAISCPVEAHTTGGDVAKLVAGFPDLKVISVDGTDLLKSYRALQSAIEFVRSRRGPALVHARVIRPYSHSNSDDERMYKTKAEREEEARRDPITLLSDYLESEQLATSEELGAMRAEADREVADAAERALSAPIASRDSAAWWVYSPTVDPTSDAFDGTATPEGPPETMVASINRTLKDEMARNPRIFVFGQDVADASRAESLPIVQGKGGVFKATHGLQRAYGSDRVFNSPLAEADIVGRAIGMATRGLKPVVEIQFFDYIWPAMMQLRNELAMLRYRSANQFSCPLVIRVPIGGYVRGGGPYHCQSGESIFAHCPGIRIAYPSNAVDAVGLLRTSITCDDPVLFLEHKHLYRQTYNKGSYPGSAFTIPFGKSNLCREGADVVVVTWGAMVQRSLVAAQQAEKDGISAAIIDLRTIAPYDWDGIAQAVKRIARVLIVHEDQLTCGFGAEIGARIADELFAYLDAPIGRVGAMDTPVAYQPQLEETILPQSEDVLLAIRKVARY
jgi:2-oxoisovalerate dehydrogenase E1 component